jgi:hypothetical protein
MRDTLVAGTENYVRQGGRESDDIWGFCRSKEYFRRDAAALVMQLRFGIRMKGAYDDECMCLPIPSNGYW